MDETPVRTQKRKRRPRPAKGAWTLILTLLLAAAALGVFAFRDQLTAEGLRSRFHRDRTPAEDGAFAYEAGGSQVFASAGNGLAVASSSSLELFDGDGKSVFRRVVSYETPAVWASPAAALFCDLGGTDCALVRADGETVPLTPEGEILTAACNDYGWVALTTAAAGYKGLVSVYDSSGAPRFAWWSGAGYVLKAEVSPDNRVLAALCAETGGGRLHLYRLDSAEELAAVGFPGELPFDFGFLSGGGLCVLGEKALHFYSGDGGELGRYDLGNYALADYDLGSRSFTAVYVTPDRSRSGGLVQTFDSAGNPLGYAALDREPVSMSAGGDRLAVMTMGSLTVYDREMQVTYSDNTLMTAKKALLRTDGELLLLGAYAAERMGFSENRRTV